MKVEINGRVGFKIINGKIKYFKLYPHTTLKHDWEGNIEDFFKELISD